MRRLLILIWSLSLLALPAAAQDRATLVADAVSVQSGSVLVATGHVEVYFRGQRLTASAISYDRMADRLSISGPIRIDDGKGSVFTAEQAELSADLTEGLLTSARLVLNRQLQLTAAELLRSDGGNLTALRSVAASSCTICKGNPTPLWEIRASEVVHDAAAQQIYFRNATLRFYGVPVLYLPIMRVPDPTLSRATGFLNPRLRSTTALGTGIKIPFFIAMGDSRDLLITPYLTTGGDRTVELRYRQAFANGSIQVDGAVSQDHLGPVEPRGYFQATGNFDLGNDYLLAFTGVSVSDPAYLLDYGITDEDRLFNQLGLTRIRRDLNFSAELIGFRSIREGDTNSTLPTAVTDISYERRFTPPLLGGVAAVKLDTHADYVADGRDLARVGLTLDWRRNWTTTGGIAISALSNVSADNYSISQDAEFGGNPGRVAGAFGVELRWPWVKTSARNVTQLIEPVVQAVVSSRPLTTIPNGDSTLVEFDEGNLFALDRYPGADAVEGGARLNLGVNYRRTDPKGWTIGATLGRVVRLEDLGQFSNASGLAGTQSDWLIAWSLSDQDGLSLTNRLILDDDLSLTKGELRFDLANRTLDVSGGYEYLLADPDEDRLDNASEIVLNAGRNLSRNWRAELSTRYDLRADRLANAGLKLDFRNECIDVTLSLSRRYTSSTSVSASTDFGLSVELLGFGGGSAAGPSQVCRR